MAETTELVLTFAVWLREQRLRSELTMAELAQCLGVTPQFISLLEGGRRYPSDKLVQRCAKEFGEDLNYLRFLVQKTPIEEKEALLRSPLAPEFLRGRVPNVKPNVEGPDDILIQKLLEDTGLFRPDPDSEYGVDFYFTGWEPIRYFPSPQGLLAEMIYTDRERFGANVVAWAEFYKAFYWACMGSRTIAYRELLELHERLRLETAETYPLKLRFLVAFHLTLLEGTKGLHGRERQDIQETEKLFQEALGYAKAASNCDWEQLVLRLRWRLGLNEGMW